MKKISSTIIFSIASCVIITSIFVGFISIRTAKGQVIPEAEGRMEAVSKQYANEIDMTYVKYESIVQGLEQYIMNTLDSGKAYDPEYMDEYMTEIRYYLLTISKQNDMQGMYVFSNPSLMQDMIGAWVKGSKTISIDKNCNYSSFMSGEDDRFEFFYKAEADRKAGWLNPKIYADEPEESITYYAPIMMAGKLQAVIGMDVSFENIRTMINDLEVYETGHAFMLSNNQEFLIDTVYTEADTLESAGYTKLQEAIAEAPDGFLTMIDQNGTECYVAYSTLANGSIICVMAPTAEVIAGIDAMRQTIIVIVAIICLISCFIAFMVGKRISNPLVAMVKDLSLMQDGNFTGHKYRRYMKRRNEIGKLSRAIEVIQTSMKNVIGTITDGSGEVNNSVVQLSGVIENLSDQVSNISSISEELAASMQETAATADNLSLTAERMADYVGVMDDKNREGNEAVSDIAVRAGKLNEDSLKSVKATDVLIEETKAKMEQAILDSKQVEQINSLTEAILTIADQTSLLSLNASIEAARAGESGRGFAVVADEIRKLAETSEETAMEIQKIVGSVHTSVENLCDCSDEVLRFMETGMRETHKKLLETSKQYNGDAENMKRILDEFSQIANEIGEEVSMISQAFTDLKQATAEGATGTNEVARNAEMVMTNAVSLKDEGTHLEKLSETLDKTISEFTIE